MRQKTSRKPEYAAFGSCQKRLRNVRSTIQRNSGRNVSLPQKNFLVSKVSIEFHPGAGQKNRSESGLDISLPPVLHQTKARGVPQVSEVVLTPPSGNAKDGPMYVPAEPGSPRFSLLPISYFLFPASPSAIMDNESRKFRAVSPSLRPDSRFTSAVFLGKNGVET